MWERAWAGVFFFFNWFLPRSGILQGSSLASCTVALHYGTNMCFWLHCSPIISKCISCSGKCSLSLQACWNVCYSNWLPGIVSTVWLRIRNIVTLQSDGGEKRSPLWKQTLYVLSSDAPNWNYLSSIACWNESSFFFLVFTENKSKLSDLKAAYGNLSKHEMTPPRHK